MRAFVTGGSGFHGRELVRALRDRGDQVRALARSERPIAAVREAGAEAVHGDLGSADAMRAGLQDCHVVFHAAAHTEEWDTDEAFHPVTVAGTVNVIEAARGAGVARLVRISSESVLADGRPLVRIDDTHPYPARALRYRSGPSFPMLPRPA